MVVLLGRWNWWPASLHDRHVVLEARRHRRAGKPAGLAREPITLAGERLTLAGEPVTRRPASPSSWPASRRAAERRRYERPKMELSST